jgi:hypothetical protein
VIPSAVYISRFLAENLYLMFFFNDTKVIAVFTIFGKNLVKVFPGLFRG